MSNNLNQYKGDNETVLLVEDEKAVLNSMEMILEDYNYNYYSAEKGEEALELFPKIEDEVDVLISDTIMPGMDGIEVADRLKQQKEDLKVILSSGYSEDRIEKVDLDKREYKFIHKPYNLEKLLKLIRETLDQNKGKRETGKKRKRE